MSAYDALAGSYDALMADGAHRRRADALDRRLRRSRAGTRLHDFAAYILFPILLLLLSTASLVGDSYNPFIYFQF